VRSKCADPLPLSNTFLGVGSVGRSRQLQRNSGEFSSWRDIYSGGRGMGLRSFFRRDRTAAGDTAGSMAVVEPQAEEPLTPEELAELQEAWAEFAEAAKGSGVNRVHALYA
jgi:hypothetical protein